MGRHPCREGKEKCRRYRARWSRREIHRTGGWDRKVSRRVQSSIHQLLGGSSGSLSSAAWLERGNSRREAWARFWRGGGCSNSLARASGSGWLWWVENFQLLGSPVRPPRHSQIRRCWLLAFSAVGGTGRQHFPFQWDSTELVHFNHIFLVLSSPFFAREAGKGTTEQSGPCQVLAP